MQVAVGVSGALQGSAWGPPSEHLGPVCVQYGQGPQPVYVQQGQPQNKGGGGNCLVACESFPVVAVVRAGSVNKAFVVMVIL